MFFLFFQLLYTFLKASQPVASSHLLRACIWYWPIMERGPWAHCIYALNIHILEVSPTVFFFEYRDGKMLNG